MWTQEIRTSITPTEAEGSEENYLACLVSICKHNTIISLQPHHNGWSGTGHWFQKTHPRLIHTQREIVLCIVTSFQPRHQQQLFGRAITPSTVLPWGKVKTWVCSFVAWLFLFRLGRDTGLIFILLPSYLCLKCSLEIGTLIYGRKGFIAPLLWELWRSFKRLPFPVKVFQVSEKPTHSTHF